MVCCQPKWPEDAISATACRNAEARSDSHVGAPARNEPRNSGNSGTGSELKNGRVPAEFISRQSAQLLPHWKRRRAPPQGTTASGATVSPARGRSGLSCQLERTCGKSVLNLPPAHGRAGPPQSCDSNWAGRDTMPRMPRLPRKQAVREATNASVVLPFPIPESDVGLVTALRAGHPDAVRALCSRHSGYLIRVAARILGPDDSLIPVVAGAIRWALETLDELTEPRALKAWLVSKLVVACRNRLKIRRRWHWLRSRKHSLPCGDGQYWSARMLASYRVLERMQDEQRIVFCLIVIHSMEIAEVATVLGVSLSRVRTVLEKASCSFAQYVRSEPLIAARALRSA